MAMSVYVRRFPLGSVSVEMILAYIWYLARIFSRAFYVCMDGQGEKKRSLCQSTRHGGFGLGLDRRICVCKFVEGESL